MRSNSGKVIGEFLAKRTLAAQVPVASAPHALTPSKTHTASNKAGRAKTGREAALEGAFMVAFCLSTRCCDRNAGKSTGCFLVGLSHVRSIRLHALLQAHCHEPPPLRDL